MTRWRWDGNGWTGLGPEWRWIGTVYPWNLNAMERDDPDLHKWLIETGGGKVPREWKDRALRYVGKGSVG